MSSMNLEVICDVQEVADDFYYRLSDDKVVKWASAKTSAVLKFKYPDLDVAKWKQLCAGASSESQIGMSRDEKIKALEDADKARGNKDQIIFAAALVSDYLPPSWAEKLLADFNLSLSDVAQKNCAPTTCEKSGSSDTAAPASRPREYDTHDKFDNKKPKAGSAPGRLPDKGGAVRNVLSKVEQFAKKGLSTKGMSSMASFFKPKAK